MKTFNLKALFLCLLLIAFLSPKFSILHAQDSEEAKKAPEPLVIVYSYMKTKNADYEKVEKEIWQPFFQKQIDNDKQIFWGIYAVEFPFGKEREYDYVAINVYANMEQMDNAFKGFEKKMKKVHPNMDMKKMNKRTENSRDLVWGEVFEGVGGAVPITGKVPNILMVNRMQSKPGKYDAYVDMEMNVFRPAHKVAVEKGYRANWHFMRRILPYGSDYGYNFITIDAYESMTQMGKNVPESVWETAHPGKKFSELMNGNSPMDLRDLTRGEVWSKVAHAIKSEEMAEKN